MIRCPHFTNPDNICSPCLDLETAVRYLEALIEPFQFLGGPSSSEVRAFIARVEREHS